MGTTRSKAGRKPLAPEVQRARGYYKENPERENKHAPAANGDEPVMPEFLGKLGQEKWKELVVDLRRMGILSSETREMLISYCQAWQGWHDAMEIINEDGLLDIAGKKHPLCSERDKHRDTMNRLLPEFGLTPSSRGRLISLAPPKEEDPFNEVLDMMNPSSN